MPELKGIPIKGFEDEDQDIIDAIPYKDKKREEKRLAELKEKKSKLAEYHLAVMIEIHGLA